MAGLSPASGGDVPVQTLSGQDPELAARHAQYLARKKAKQGQRKPIDQGQFLSNVQEIDADVAYRFNFHVVGNVSENLVVRVCSSRRARSLGGSSSSAGPEAGAYRCLCEVMLPPPLKGQPQAQAPTGKQVAKLAIRTMEFSDAIPGCESRQETMNTALVYVLCIDSVDPDGLSDFENQLKDYGDALAVLRSSTKAKLRPVKAVLLCCQQPEGSPKDGVAPRWPELLADFEAASGGDMWKFGPICLEDKDALHAAFAEMTSTRIARARDEPGGEDGAGEGADKDDGADAELNFKPSAGVSKLTRMTSPGGSDAGSSVSERERPPHYDTEMSGSECSETAVEHHERTMGALAGITSPTASRRGSVSSDGSEPEPVLHLQNLFQATKPPLVMDETVLIGDGGGACGDGKDASPMKSPKKADQEKSCIFC